MICRKCGVESDGNFCVNCGADLRNGDAYVYTNDPYHPTNPVADVINNAGSNGMILTICILSSIASFLSLYAGGWLVILYTIFMWIFYTKACRKSIDFKHIRNVSGTVFAETILYYVAAAAYVLLGVLLLLFYFLFEKNPQMTYAMLEAFEVSGIYSTYPEIASMMTPDFILVFWLVLAVVCMVMGVLFLLLALLCFRKLHTFIKSLYQSVEYGVFMIKKGRTAANWILVLGILMAISAVLSLITNPIVGVANGLIAVCMIIGSVWIKKYICVFETNYYQPQNNDQTFSDF